MPGPESHGFPLSIRMLPEPCQALLPFFTDWAFSQRGMLLISSATTLRVFLVAEERGYKNMTVSYEQVIAT